MYPSWPAWVTYVMALAPTPKAQCPGLSAGARANARACPVFDCDSNFAAWQSLQAWLPTYCAVAIELTGASSRTVWHSVLRITLPIAGLQYNAVAPDSRTLLALGENRLDLSLKVALVHQSRRISRRHSSL